MKSLALALCFTAVSALDAIELRFMNYLAKYGKKVQSIDEFEARLANFTKMDKKIQEINSNSENTWTAGHNHLSDWSREEYEKLLGALPLDD